MNEAEALFSKVKTLEQGEAVVDALTQLRGSKSARKLISSEVLSLIYSVGKVNSYSDLLEGFKRHLYATPTVMVTLAFYPSKTLLARLTKWFEDNLEERVLLDLQVEGEIIGGAKILCNDHFRDYSIASKLVAAGVNLPKAGNVDVPVAVV